ncbi:MAG: hypothetical protein ABSB76_04680 [Streptosporangiaceae bacterium]|jgi:hypothetical protein
MEEQVSRALVRGLFSARHAILLGVLAFALNVGALVLVASSGGSVRGCSSSGSTGAPPSSWPA